jgi:hypothetical protein
MMIYKLINKCNSCDNLQNRLDNEIVNKIDLIHKISALENKLNDVYIIDQTDYE